MHAIGVALPALREVQTLTPSALPMAPRVPPKGKPRTQSKRARVDAVSNSRKGSATKDAICAELKREQPLSPSELSERLGQPASRLSYHCRQLEQAGRVVRVGSSRRLALAGTPAKEAP